MNSFVFHNLNPNSQNKDWEDKTRKENQDFQFITIKTCRVFAPYPTLSKNFDSSQSEIFALWIVFLFDNFDKDCITFSSDKYYR